MIPRNWKIAGLTAIAVGGLTGVAFANDGIELNDRSNPIVLAENIDNPDDVGFVDVSPESADSPAVSPFDSPESPTDSPDDVGFVDVSPESADSPTESPFDSPVEASDLPAPSSNNDEPDSPDLPDSPDDPDSPDLPDSPD